MFLWSGVPCCCDHDLCVLSDVGHLLQNIIIMLYQNINNKEQKQLILQNIIDERVEYLTLGNILKVNILGHFCWW
jgi:hypothetical protein